jgi:hypothetical protein
MNYSIVAMAVLIVAAGAAVISPSSLFSKAKERTKHFEQLKE